MEGFKQGAQTGGLREHGERMGFKYGGSVKNTSSEFVQKTSKQDSMDTGTQPPRKGRNQAEIEAGGTKKMLPGYKKGGKMKKSKHKGDYDNPGDRRMDSGKKMPKNVKAKGGKAGYMKGGNVDAMAAEEIVETDYKKGGKAKKYAEGGLAAAKKVMDQHVKAAPPKGHGVKKAKGGRTMHMRGGSAGRKVHNSTPMVGQ